MIRTGQQGQALVEGIAGLAALAVLFWAIPVLGRYQDIALQSAHASRHAAFLLTQSPDNTEQAQLATLAWFANADRRWQTASGGVLMPDAPVHVMQRVQAAAANQPGSNHSHAAALRREWLIGDDGILRATVHATPLDVLAAQSSKQRPGLPLSRSTAVMTGAGYATTDQNAQERVANGASGWAAAANRSASAGRAVAGPMTGVDAAWGRPQPEFDWLLPWTALVPADRLGAKP